MISSSSIKRLVAEAGFDLCGVIRAEAYADERCHLMEWLGSGRGDGVEYMQRNIDLRLNSEMIVDGAKSIVVCALNYKRESSTEHLTKPRIAQYAQMRDYHKTIRKALKGVLTAIQSESPEVNGRLFTDSAPLLEKRMACEAGLGWIGRHSLLVNPRYGSYLLLGEIVLDAEVDIYDAPAANVGCGSCRRCVDSCPVAAIGEDRTIDTRVCISAQTIETDGSGYQHGWVFGCDLCIESCPHSMNTPLSISSITERTIEPPTKDEWMEMSTEEFEQRFAGSPIRRSSLQRIKDILDIQ